ncbi:MAG: carboxymuconolactone decarboxylase family protein [Gemmatimonadota bacterium]
MAFIRYVPEAELPTEARVPDRDHIIQIHAIHPAVMRAHWELYVELMHRAGPLSRRQRELIAIRVSALNQCHY